MPFRSRHHSLGFCVSAAILCGLVLELAPGCGGDSGGLGAEDSGADGGACGFVTSFVSPADKAKLGQADDTSGKRCADGLVTTVKVATSAPDGTQASLYYNDTKLATASVTAAQAVFVNVSLPAKSTGSLKVQVGSDPGCVASASIVIDCGVPACAISAPKGPYLNGRPVAEGGDRVNATTEPFATAAEVTTDIEDGQTVTLTVDGGTPQTATASGGKAKFEKVTMAPDGVHNLAASCKNAAGNVGGSGSVPYTVLTAPVDLTVSEPKDGAAFGIADDIDSTTAGVQFKVCGTTTTAAAIDVPSDAKLGQKNFCAGIGTGTPVCESMKAAGVCATVTCPDGSAPFDVDITLSDKAGNQAKIKRTGIRCESKLPSVQVVSPKKYDPADSSTILNASRGEAGTTSGSLKKTVVACTDKGSAKAQLYLGMAGSALVAAGAPVDVAPATGPDGCPTGFGFVARFPGVTLPESKESTDGKGTLVTATELRVDVTDAGLNTGKSPLVDVWVDSVPPTMSLFSPSCGKAYSGTTDITDDLVFLSETKPMLLKVTAGTTTDTYTISDFDAVPTVLPAKATVKGAKIHVGDNKLSLTATDAAGNAADAFATSTCTLYVGTPPVVSITSPTDGQKFPFDTNVDLPTYKYKTSVTGTITGATSATNVTLKLGGSSAGTTAISGGAFTFSSVLLPENDALTVSVELVDSKYGTIGRTVTVVVDTHVPSAPSGLSGSPNAATRRAGGVDVSWVAGSDPGPGGIGTRPCDHYELRRASSQVSTETIWGTATVVSSSIVGGATGTTASGLRLPADYFFGLRCADKAGNLSPIASNSTAISVAFIEATFTATGETAAGAAAGGGFDINGDGVPDLLLGTRSGHALLYLGHKPTSATDPGFDATKLVTLTGGASNGYHVAELKDFDGDGRADIVVGDPGTKVAYIISGKAFTSTSSGSMAASSFGSNELTVQGDVTAPAALGHRVASVGNFDGDTGGRTDLAVRGIYGGNWGLSILAGRVIDGSTLKLPTDGAFLIKSDLGPGSSNFAFAVASQDLNADGFSDLVLTDNVVGKWYSYAGRSTATKTYLPSDADGSNGAGPVSDIFGVSVGLPGGVGSSGIDLLVGALGAAGGNGKAYVWKGAGASFGAPIEAITGPSSIAQLGATVISTPPGTTFDVDKDGRADVLACSAPSDGSAGKCYLWYGQALSPSPGWTPTNAATSFGIEWDGTTVTYGSAVTIGDIDGDGYQDFAICSTKTSICRVIR